MSQWAAEITNNPEKDYELYVELLEDDEYRARIEMVDAASLVLRVYHTETDVVLPVEWPVHILDLAKKEIGPSLQSE